MSHAGKRNPALLILLVVKKTLTSALGPLVVSSRRVARNWREWRQHDGDTWEAQDPAYHLYPECQLCPLASELQSAELLSVKPLYREAGEGGRTGKLLPPEEWAAECLAPR